MNYLVAVSGGIDSVVLLDIFSRTEHRLTVAHVDHGIREDSTADARFVEALASHYSLPFVCHKANLGTDASEERARDARYEFLFREARRLDATIITAQHLDDLVETVALNFERGTGWRGLAVMAREGIWRPFLQVPKSVLYAYAVNHRLEWVEDDTNRTMFYQRNRIRARLSAKNTLSLREEVHSKWIHQLKLRRSIGDEVGSLLQTYHGSRYFLTQLDEALASEFLGTEIAAAGGTRPTRPQLIRALLAIKTARPGTACQVGNGVTLEFETRNYRVKVV